MKSQNFVKSLKAEEVVKQSNALTTAAYELSRNEKRILFLCLNKVYKKDFSFNEKEKAYEVSFSYQEYDEVFNDDSTHLARNVYQAVSGFMLKKVVFYVPDNDCGGVKATKERSWINGFDHNPRLKNMCLYFNPPVFDVISNTEREFTLYLLTVVGKINNPYAMRLYELICQWRKTRTTFTHSIEWLKDRFKLPKSYDRMPDFRRSFLNVVVKEINEKTDIELSAEELCDGLRKNKVTHIKFSWAIKSLKVNSSLSDIQCLYSEVLKGQLLDKDKLIYLLSCIDDFIGQGGIEKSKEFIVMWAGCMAQAK